MTTIQLALAVQTAPIPGAYVRLDEIGLTLHTERETGEWWQLLRRRMHDRITTVAVRFPGDLIDIACHDRTHAEWLRDEFRRRGVPQRSVSIRGQQT